jgi:imidazolonepropionase-like amidohydrolase
MRTLLSLLFLAAFSAASYAQTVVVRAGHLLDVANGRIIDNQSILIVDGKITAVGARVLAPDGTPVIDLSDQYVMPGLIDAHTHLALMEMDGSDINDFGSYYYASLIEDTSMRVAQGTQMARSMLEIQETMAFTEMSR